jgi:hypothetical protein
MPGLFLFAALVIGRAKKGGPLDADLEGFRSLQ